MLQQGIDSQVNTQANALRDNPKAMGQAQQEQKASLGKGIQPPLMRALALQKVASETAAAENQLKLSMQQNPATIVEQLEQNAVARTQDDLLKQTAGIMGERNKKRQQQVSAAKPPQQPQQQQQRPPMPQGAPPQGIAGAPRPPTQFAAQGGIIGYAAGEKVEGEGSRLEQALKAIGISYKDYMAMRPEQKKGVDARIQQEYIKQRKEYKVPEMPISGMIAKAMEPTPERVASDAAAKANYDKKQSTGKLGLDALLADESLMQEEEDQVAAVDTQAAQASAAAPVVQAEYTPTPEEGLGSILNQVGIDKEALTMPTLPTPDNKQVSKAVGSGITNLIGKNVALDPTKAREDELSSASDFYRRDDADKKRTAATDNIKSLYDAQMSDENIEAQRRRAMILGTIKGGRLGGGLEAVENTRNAQSKARIERLEKYKTNVDADIKADFDVASKIGGQAFEMFKEVSAAQQTAMNAGISLSEADIAMAKQDAALFQDRYTSEINARLKTAGIMSDQELQTSIAEASSYERLNDLAVKVSNAKAAVLEMVSEINDTAEIKRLRKDRDDGKELSASDVKLLARSDAIGQTITEQLNTQYQTILNKIAAMNGVSFKSTGGANKGGPATNGTPEERAEALLKGS